MDYKETLEYLFSSLPVYQRIGSAAYKANLDNTYALDNHFNHPHKKFRSIHIAGTNGKGSVSHMIASILAEAGYKTGLYTSPHLRDFTERIRVNGVPVAKDFVVSFVNDNRAILESVKPSFFEMTVAMAFEYFAFCDIDIAVIETGMGGRLDSTNIIIPDLSVITNIGLDHTQFLGPDLGSIAGEKAGIIKTGVPVVIGETQVSIRDLFVSIAKSGKSEIFFADKDFRVEAIEADYHNGVSLINIFQGKTQIVESLKFPLAGRYQEKNIQTVMMAMNFPGNPFGITIEHIISGLSNVIVNTSLEGRWQVLGNNPLIICDTAHNMEGLSIVIDQLARIECGIQRFVIGFVNDKDIRRLLELFPSEAEYYFTTISVPRSLDGKEIANVASEMGLNGSCYDSVGKAYKAAIEDAGRDDLIYIGGSTFVVADLLNYLNE